MRRIVLLIACIMCLSTLSCRLLPFAKIKSSQQEQRTLFDQLISLAPNKQVPYPFAELLSYLSQYGNPVAILVPLGLSQLRKDNYPHPFKDPRRIVGFTAHDTYDNEQTLYFQLFKQLGMPKLKVGEFSIASRLFLAYTEKTQQIEAMSLLPSGVGFDYQVVKNYGKDSAPLIANANKKHCRTCHQFDEPLTQTGLGSGSNITPMIARLIARHHLSGELDGIPIVIADKQTPRTKEKKSESGDESGVRSWLLSEAMKAILSFDNMLEHVREQVTTTINNNMLWRDGCKRPKNIKECRRLLLQQRFGCYDGVGESLFTLSQLIPCQNTEMKVRNFYGGERLVENEANYLTNDASMRQGFSLSAAGKRVLSKIKSTRLGDLDPQIDKVEAGLFAVVSIFLEAGGGDVDFAMPLALPPLSKEDIAIIHDEVERLFVHIHSQDLHLNTAADPAHKRKLYSYVTRHGLSFPIDDAVAKKFIQLTRLSLPSKKDTISIDGVTILQLSRSSNALRYLTIAFQLANGDTILGRHTADTGRTTAACQEIKRVHECKLNNLVLDTPTCQSCQSVILDITFRAVNDQQAKPPLSTGYVKIDGKGHRFALLCGIEDQSQRYVCVAHDAWKIKETFAKLVADSHSALHADYFNPTAIIRDMLAYLGDK